MTKYTAPTSYFASTDGEIHLCFASEDGDMHALFRQQEWRNMCFVMLLDETLPQNRPPTQNVSKRTLIGN